MKDVNVKGLGGKLCYGVVAINDKEYNVNSEYTLMSHIYNEMYGKEYSFRDIVKKYINSLSAIKDKDELSNYRAIINSKLS